MSTTTTASHPSSTLECYLRDIGRFRVLGAEEERDLARAARDGDRGATQALVRANLRFVVRIANEYRRFGLPIPDLIQEGNIGLMTAARKFDPDRGCRLVSYASWWIRAHIHAFILRSCSVVRLADARTLPRITVGDALAHARAVERWAGDADALEVALAASDHAEAPRADAMLRGRVVEALDRLDRRERYLVEMRILRDVPLTLKEVGEQLGFSRERARQIEERARKKLKEYLQPVSDGEERPAPRAVTAATRARATRRSRAAAAPRSSPPPAPATA